MGGGAAAFLSRSNRRSHLIIWISTGGEEKPEAGRDHITRQQRGKTKKFRPKWRVKVFRNTVYRKAMRKGALGKLIKARYLIHSPHSDKREWGKERKDLRHSALRQKGRLHLSWLLKEWIKQAQISKLKFITHGGVLGKFWWEFVGVLLIWKGLSFKCAQGV